MEKDIPANTAVRIPTLVCVVLQPATPPELLQVEDLLDVSVVTL